MRWMDEADGANHCLHSEGQQLGNTAFGGRVGNKGLSLIVPPGLGEGAPRASLHPPQPLNAAAFG